MKRKATTWNYCYPDDRTKTTWGQLSFILATVWK